jgi:hypothetical protein
MACRLCQGMKKAFTTDNILSGWHARLIPIDPDKVLYHLELPFSTMDFPPFPLTPFHIENVFKTFLITSSSPDAIKL